LDGTRKTPPGREARNLSRRDGIRAGSVSGPWRSVPKAEDAAGASPEPQRPPATAARPPLEWTGRGNATGQPEPEASFETTPAQRPEPEPRAALPGADHRDAVPLRGTRGLAGWIVFGLGVAAALVAAAVFLRPDPVVPVAEPAADAAAVPQAEAEDVAETAPVPPVPEAEVETGVVRLRVGPDAEPAEVTRITEALEGAGVGPIRVETLPFAITQSRVGYYRPEDEAAANALAELAGPLIGPGEVGLRNYGDLLADTEPGRLDLWLGE
jgi:hypothetical protein